MAGYCDASKLKEARNWDTKTCLHERTILRLLDRFSSLFYTGFPDELQKSKFSTAQDNFGKIIGIERTELCFLNV